MPVFRVAQASLCVAQRLARLSSTPGTHTSCWVTDDRQSATTLPTCWGLPIGKDFPRSKRALSAVGSEAVRC